MIRGFAAAGITHVRIPVGSRSCSAAVYSNVEDLTGRLDVLASEAATRETERVKLERSVAENRTALTAKEEERRSHLEEHQGLEDERIRLVDERSALRAASAADIFSPGLEHI